MSGDTLSWRLMPAGRPRKFNEEEVLERAMMFFWTHGFKKPGVSELLDHLGIARQSLYGTFGNKRALFIKAIKHYRTTRLSEALSLLEREGSPIENVKSTVGFFEKLALDEGARGCLVANALVEFGDEDKEICELLDETLGLLEKGLKKALKHASTIGELPAGKEPRALARALTNASIGMAVTSRLPKSRAAVADAYAGTLSMLS